VVIRVLFFFGGKLDGHMVVLTLDCEEQYGGH
jgi:hypothetical protein